jgi:thiosulfate dehydrogenase [quinone] large subunit
MQTARRDEALTCTAASLFALVGVMALAIRLVQGWIFWGGASRRLFYDFQSVHGTEYAVKMDPNLAGYLANKMVHAMPGSLFPDLIEWVLLHGGVLHFMVWFWTLLELVVGVGLILGLATRLLAFTSLALNVSLMLIFGWMGSTCVDEWTMAASGFAMGATLMLTGGGALSLDQWLGNRAPALASHGWFRLLFSGPLSLAGTRRWGIVLGIVSLLFTAGFYQYLHGAVVSPLRSRVNFHDHGLSLTDVRTQRNGSVSFHADIDAGPDTGKLYLIRAQLLDARGQAIEHWDGAALSALPETAITNLFTQPWGSKVEPTQYGLGGITGAKATIRLPGQHALPPGEYRLKLSDIDGRHWEAAVAVE